MRIICTHLIYCVLSSYCAASPQTAEISTSFPLARSPNGDCARRSDTDNIRAKIVARADDDDDDDDARIRSYAFVTNEILFLFVYIYIYYNIMYILFSTGEARERNLYMRV